MLKLFVARHSNTFDKGDEVLRVGKRTDLPLSSSGRLQAKQLGTFLKRHHQDLTLLDKVFVSNLIRTQQTAKIALEVMALENNLDINPLFDEIDYGLDEGQPEIKVLERIGQAALDQWESSAIVPKGWVVNPEKIINGWKNFANELVEKYQQHHATNILVVTSNGIARFSPYITGNFEAFIEKHSIKMKTGAVSCFEYQQSSWRISYWNQK